MLVFGSLLFVAVALNAALALGGTRRQAAVFVPPKPWLWVYKVPSGSMEPTLIVGQRVFVEAPAATLRVGDIVVFHPPEGAEHGLCGPKAHQVTPGGAACARPIPQKSGTTFIKRVVAGPGEWIYVKQGHAYTSKSEHGPFKREHDPYIRACGNGSECNFPTPIEVPTYSYYMLGDNRGNSEDSRFYGAIPRSWIIGKVVAVAHGR